MMWALMSVAFAGKWDGVSSDVVASRTMSFPPSAIVSALSDPAQLSGFYPTECAEWSAPFYGTGVGAATEVRYRAAGWNRKLSVTLSQVVPERSVDLYHPGSRGFTTRFYVETEGSLSRVLMTTYVNAPKWPFTSYYFKKVKPAWEDCQRRTLANVEAKLAAPAPSPQ